MKKIQYISTCFFLVFIVFEIQGQLSIYSSTGSEGAPFGEGLAPTTRIKEIKYTPKLTGSTYLYDDWLNGNLVFAKDTNEITNLKIRLDIFNNVVEIKYFEEIKILPYSQVLSVAIPEKTEIFITKNILGPSSAEGFFKVIYNKKSTLLSHCSTKIKKSNYNEAMAVGNRDDEIIKVNNFYALIDNKLLELEKTKGKLADQFKEYPEVASYIHVKKINPKKEEQLIDLLNFIDNHQ
ncbi:MAG: hypothetical protein JXB49_10405 [Bacteroidales bacterium]|nr:hypothetical protein [Bacteroidales bacterium]